MAYLWNHKETGQFTQEKKNMWLGLCPNLPLRAPNNFIFCIVTVEKEEHRLRSEESVCLWQGSVILHWVYLSIWSNRQNY